MTSSSTYKTRISMNVELMHVMGDDMSIYNTAVISKRRQSNSPTHAHDGFIKNMVKNGELQAFLHPQIQFLIRAPIEVSHRLRKHSDGTKWNELGDTKTGLKHLDQQVEFYTPTRERWREKSDGENVLIDESTMDLISDLYDRSRHAYQHLVESKRLAPEEAALILPRSTYTEWVWTANLLAFSRICQIYSHKDANVELKEITKQISDLIGQSFPISWKYLLGSF